MSFASASHEHVLRASNVLLRKTIRRQPIFSRCSQRQIFKKSFEKIEIDLNTVNYVDSARFIASLQFLDLCRACLATQVQPTSNGASPCRAGTLQPYFHHPSCNVGVGTNDNSIDASYDSSQSVLEVE